MAAEGLSEVGMREKSRRLRGMKPREEMEAPGLVVGAQGFGEQGQEGLRRRARMVSNRGTMVGETNEGLSLAYLGQGLEEGASGATGFDLGRALMRGGRMQGHHAHGHLPTTTSNAPGSC